MRVHECLPSFLLALMLHWGRSLIATEMDWGMGQLVIPFFFFFAEICISAFPSPFVQWQAGACSRGIVPQAWHTVCCFLSCLQCQSRACPQDSFWVSKGGCQGALLRLPFAQLHLLRVSENFYRVGFLCWDGHCGDSAPPSRGPIAIGGGAGAGPAVPSSQQKPPRWAPHLSRGVTGLC